MPQYFKDAKGALHEFPDDATPEEIDEATRSLDAPRADFSNVSASVSSTERAPDSGTTRDIKMGARSVLQGAGGLIGALGGDAFNYYVVDPIRNAVHSPSVGDLVTGNTRAAPSPSYRDAAGSLADRLGLPKPQNAQERVMGDVGEALTGTGLTMGVGGLVNAGRNAVSTVAPTITSRLGDLLTAQPKLQAISTATGSGAASLTRESGGGGGAQLLAGLAGGIGPGALSALGGAATRGLVRGRSGAGMQQAIDDFGALGATPSVGQASGNSIVQGAENLLAGAPTSAGVMGRFAERQADKIGAGLQGKAEDFYRNASGERAGKAVERGIDTFAGNVRAMRKALYWRADKLIPDTTVSPLTRTSRALQELTTPTAGAEATSGALINPKIATLAENISTDLANGNLQGLPYAAVKDVRSKIGEALSDFSLTTDKPTAEYKKLYAALSQDMEEAARKQGPDAIAAVKRANTYFKASQERLDDVQRVVDKNGGPERVFSAVMTGTKDGGTTLRAVMQSLPKEGQRAVTAAVIKRMGLANPGVQDEAGEVFSAATFLTNWNKVSPEAKRALFDRHGPGFAKDMDRIAKVADNIKMGSKVFANPSGTANRAAAIGYWLSLAGSAGTGQFDTAGYIAGGGVLSNVLARAMTNPKAVKWLANSTALPVGSAVAQLQALRQIGERDKDPELVELADAFSEQQRVNDQSGTGN